MRALAALGRPRVAVMLALGFSSGLPFMLIGNTLGYWLAERRVSLAAIGFLSWAGMPYLMKFVWGAAVDRLRPPLAGRLGRRRSWMVASQLAVALGLFAMAAVDPGRFLALLAACAVFTGIAAATQDTVIDAWRIESAADPEELGLLTAAYTLGYRAALIATEALILVIAQDLSWPIAYALFGAAMSVGLAAAFFAREPERADEVMEAKSAAARSHPLAGAWDAVAGPIAAFFRQHGLAAAAIMLTMITLYHLSDYLRGPMSNPFYVALGIGKPTVAAVRGTIGLAGSLVGIALGGLSCLRLGVRPSLVIGAIAQPLAIALFALLAWRHGDFALLSAGGGGVSAYALIMGLDAVAIGFSGVALVSYMSTFTSLGYTATQYALLTSAVAWTGKTLKGFSGLIVEGLHHPGRTLLEAYGEFYLLAAAVGAPAVVLCLIAPRPRLSR
jgi:PAT family beta-lactamase induction signal transducer AmpG